MGTGYMVALIKKLIASYENIVKMRRTDNIPTHVRLE